MQKKLFSRMRLWIAMMVGVTVWIAGSGFLKDLSATSDETYEGLKLFTDVLELVEKNYVDSVESKQLIEDAIQGLVTGLDPHSSLMTPKDFKELQVDTHGEFTGIGVSITMRDEFVTVISPIEGTPAYQSGIQAGDRIVQVDGKPTRDLREAVSWIRGPKGSEVVLTIIREGQPEPLEFTLERDVIPIESVRSLVLQPGYGYVWITNFNEHTTDDLRAALTELENGDLPLKGLILDLRDNPGGLLDQSVKVADLFLQEGKILTIEGRQSRNSKVFNANSDDPPRTYPMVVLINGGSASASEIVAGALQDQKRALIVGTSSFGKGSVQNVEPLRDGYGLKLTVARYYTPSGRSIQAKGIVPDVPVVARRIPPEELAAVRRIKEKDLSNHLSANPDPAKPAGDGKAEPQPDDSPKGSSPKTDKPNAGDPEADNEKDAQDETSLRLGPLTPERLKSDQQVLRGLEILMGYDILKAFNR
jgi:carboxyl-terminal processing protease